MLVFTWKLRFWLILASFVWFPFVLDHKGPSEFGTDETLRLKPLILDLVLVCLVLPVVPHISLCGART